MGGSGSGLSLWPKLLLWGTVIAVGFLYLASVDKQGRNHDRDGIATESVDEGPVEGAGGKVTGAAEVDLTKGRAGTGGQADSIPGAEIGTAAVQTVIHQAVAPEMGQVAAVSVESAQAPRDLAAQPTVLVDQAANDATTVAEGPAVVGSALVERSVAEDVPSGQGSIAQTATVGGASPPSKAVLEQSHPIALEAPAEVTPKDAKVSAKVVGIDSGAMDAGQATSTQEMAQRPRKMLGAPLGGAEFMPPDSVRESMDARRARIMAEYDAMRKGYQEQMRRSWGQRRMPVWPGVNPYGGYPGSAPDFYPLWQQ